MASKSFKPPALVRDTAWTWGLAGLLIPLLVVIVGGEIPHSLHHLAMLGTLALLTAVFSFVEADFEVAGQRVTVSPHTEPLLVAAVLLAPRETMLVALVGIAWSSFGQSPFGTLTNIANTVLAYTAAALAVHALFPDPTSLLQLLPAVLLASVIGVVVSTAGTILALESVRRGRGRAYLRSVPNGVYFDVGLPALAVTIAVPFLLRDLALGAVVLAGLQVFSFLGFRLLAREQTQDQRNQHLHDTFARYVPSSVVDELVDTSHHIELGGVQREITVLFCDVRGFTSWSEQLPPATIITELNAMLSELAQAVLETGGTLDKFTGDGLMAFWGAPDLQPDHADRAAQTALTMRERMARHNELRAFRGAHAMLIGVGCHSGPAIIGNVGHLDRLNYTAIGDTVNLAARLEATTKEAGCDVLLSQATFDLLSPEEAERWKPVGSFQVKGRTAAVMTYTHELSAPATLPATIVQGEAP